MQQSRFFSWLSAGALILALAILKFGFHEIWKDEWQVWMMARDMGWLELLQNLYFEGHPALWYLYVKIFTTLYQVFGGAQHLWLQSAHLLAGMGVFYVFFVRLRFPLWLKWSLALGYYLFFEYGMVNRGYIFVMLIAFLLAEAAPLYQKKPLRVALLLFLLCQVEVFSLFMAGAFTLYVLLQSWREYSFLESLKNRSVQQVLAGGIAGVLVFLLTVVPRSSERNLQAAFAEPFASDVIQTAFQGNFVNTYWIGLLPDTNVFGVTTLGLSLSAVVLALLIWFFWKEKEVLLTFLFFHLVYFLFCSGFYPGGVRQWGMSYIFFVCCLHLWWQSGQRPDWSRYVILGSILLAQIAYTYRAVEKELLFPFTNARMAGEFLKKNVPEEVPIIAINKFEATPVLAYTGRDFYALPEGETFSYFKWTEKIYLPPQQELFLFADFKKVGGIIIISYQPLDPARYPNARLWQTFDDFNLKNENYYIYTLSKN
ncbi:MAG: hypothetical protein MRY78_08595 [Saprospiraceae bacterium]|nr:hypothetical protein [Saprospiraceae bacterium]